jgi:hypothetical protein
MKSFTLKENEMQMFSVHKIRSGNIYKLNKHFTDFLTRKLNINSINCNLKCESNHFKKDDSRKINCPFWNGNYRCKKEDCSIGYKFIKRTPDSNFLLMVAEKKCAHEAYEKFSSYGSERRNLQLRLLAKGSLAVQSENFLLNSLQNENESKKIL